MGVAADIKSGKISSMVDAIVANMYQAAIGI
jgi:hypothetical protein